MTATHAERPPIREDAIRMQLRQAAQLLSAASAELDQLGQHDRALRVAGALAAAENVRADLWHEARIAYAAMYRRGEGVES